MDGTEASTVNLLRDPGITISHARRGKYAVREGADHGVVILTLGLWFVKRETGRASRTLTEHWQIGADSDASRPRKLGHSNRALHGRMMSAARDVVAWINLPKTFPGSQGPLASCLVRA